MALLGQLRLAPSGRVTGLEMTAALKLADARGYNVGVVSVLLQEAESVLVSSLNTTPEEWIDCDGHHP